MKMPDSVDERLARLLGQDARQNSLALARKLNISSASVRRRLRKLIHSGVIRIVGVVDPASFGLPLVVIITLDISNDKIELAINELKSKPEVRFVSTITGRYSIILIARFHSNAHISEFLSKDMANIEGIRYSETFICLDVKKGKYMTLGSP